MDFLCETATAIVVQWMSVVCKTNVQDRDEARATQGERANRWRAARYFTYRLVLYCRKANTCTTTTQQRFSFVEWWWWCLLPRAFVCCDRSRSTTKQKGVAPVIGIETPISHDRDSNKNDRNYCNLLYSDYVARVRTVATGVAS